MSGLMSSLWYLWIFIVLGLDILISLRVLWIIVEEWRYESHWYIHIAKLVIFAFLMTFPLYISVSGQWHSLYIGLVGGE